MKELNAYLFKGNDPERLEMASKELRDMLSPMLELEALLNVTHTLAKREKAD